MRSRPTGFNPPASTTYRHFAICLRRRLQASMVITGRPHAAVLMRMLLGHYRNYGEGRRIPASVIEYLLIYLPALATNALAAQSIGLNGVWSH